jgi:hypothetical protein
MTIFQAPPYDPRRDIRRRNRWIALVVAILVIAGLAWHFRHWPEQHAIDKFLSAIERHDYKQAYALWNADPAWEQHPQKYSGYSFGEFELDWGPTGEFGEIKSHHTCDTLNPPRGGSGVLVVFTVNGRQQPTVLWVEKGNHSLTYKPPTLAVRLEPC